MFAVTEACENKEAAYEVLEFLYEDENIQAYIDDQNAIPCKEGDFELASQLDGMTEYIESGNMTDYQDHYYPSEMAVDAQIQTFLINEDVDEFLSDFDTATGRDITEISSVRFRNTTKNTEQPSRKGAGQIMKKGNSSKRTYMLITIPILALFVCFNTVPLIRGVIYSFTNFKGFGDYDWVGFRNYMDLFTDPRVGNSYWFTIKLAIVCNHRYKCNQSDPCAGTEQQDQGKKFFPSGLLPSERIWEHW